MTSVPSAIDTPRSASHPATRQEAKPPAIVIGGNANALSIARSLGRQGVEVFALNEAHVGVRYSRFAKWIPLKGKDQSKEAWTEFLLGAGSNHLSGAVLIPASDDALEILIENYQSLTDKYRMDLFVPAAQAAMLNKWETYLAARRVDVPTPKFWLADSRKTIEELRDELVFPLLVKPSFSHHFVAKFGVKYIVAESIEKLLEVWDRIGENIQVMLVEKIPGPDSQLCSYYTYIDENGEHKFQFTKRIVRRYPPEMGVACRHVTDHIPELIEPARKLFAEVGLRGLANVEFKLDSRDGVLKLIECNARITAANVLLDRCGYQLAYYLYQRARGEVAPQFGAYPDDVYLWNPVDDIRAFALLRRRGELTLVAWLRSLFKRRVTLQYFQWSDPLPAWLGMWHRLGRVFNRK